MLQIMTPPGHTMNTISEESAEKLNIHYNEISKQQHRCEFYRQCFNYNKVTVTTPETTPSLTTSTVDPQPVAFPIKAEYELHQPETPGISTSTKRRLPKALKRPQPPSSFTCNYCQKVFANHSRMLWHRRIHDQNRVKYPCPHENCNRVYATKQASEVHYKQSHLEEGFECPVCKKVYSVRQCLEVHMRYHNGDFPYVCEQCDKRFAQKGHLTTHMHVMHNNLRYCCTEPGCMKTFKNSMSLRNHSFVHSEMPFQCAYCEKGYPQKSKLRFHINVKHNIEVSYEDLEKMRKFQESRSRYTLMMKLTTKNENDGELGEDGATGE